MKVAVYNLYWTTYGGGEQVAAGIAEHCVRQGHDVTLLGPHPVDVEMTRRRLGRSLDGCTYRRVVDDVEASAISREFDLFVNGTYLSSAIPRSALSLYYVHFPGVPRTTRQQFIATGARAGLAVLGGVNSLPSAIEGVRAGFERRIHDVSWAQQYTAMAANSAFTARWVDQLWNVTPSVLNPPVDQMAFETSRSPLVLSLGRFFDRSFGHCKKQDVLLDAWESYEQRANSDWAFSLIGGADGASREYVLALKRQASALRVTVDVNAPRDTVDRAFRSASLLWHAAGHGEDSERHPDRFEHFGIAVVEAMSAGIVPIVHRSAGPAEIVRHGVDGFHWETVEELLTISESLMNSTSSVVELGRSSRLRAAEYSYETFGRKFDELVATLR